MELAKAYVQIIPSADGIKGKLTSALGGGASAAGSSAGGIAGGALAKTMLAAVAAAKIGEKIVQGIAAAVEEGAGLEQSIGGIETLFQDSSDIVLKNAREAYRTAGLSANEYMESVTSFSASLLQGLGGDTEAAAKVADMALTDMSDNANKMGTDMELIQNAYQGFAKQNYTMLDNLKLGYGGTKTEMERLLKDAQELTGVEYNIDNLSDVYSAIHAVQGEMKISGITAEEVAEIAKNTGRTVKEQLGTTAKEGATTLSGSLAAVKSAWSNVLGYMAIGEDLQPALTALVETASTFFFGNLLPMVGNIISALPSAISTVVTTAIPYIQQNGISLISNIVSGVQIGLPNLLITAETMLNSMLNKITEKLPGVLTKGTQIVNSLVNGLLKNMPKFITTVGNMLIKMVDFIQQNRMKILNAGADILLNIVNGIVKNLPKIVTAAASMNLKMLTTIAKNLPKMLQSGVELVGKLVAGLIKALPSLIAAIPKITNSILEKIKEVDWLGLGKNIIEGIAKGIVNAAGLIKEAAKEAAEKALNAAKEKLGIHSPSRVFEVEVGKMIDLGLATGIEKNSKYVTDTMKALSAETVRTADTDLISYTRSASGSNYKAQNNESIDYDRLAYTMVKAMKKSGIAMNVDGRDFGRLIERYK